ncbi:NAD-dependent epimerase/dehydratase family protein [Halorussus ruber]|uniref:NAD-dependent epimerase/dehydratase family protein n=1 Tax=Halorussus ruber TaxID=1126238 RepID=UPI001091BD67|nr:NAD(P)-dependent oxidoreductase [Halorussus ruber]
MKIFVAGATGVLGRRLVEQFNTNGHDVVGLTRDEEGDRIVSSQGGTPHRGDVTDYESLVGGAEEADVVIHAATAIPTAQKPTAEDWEQNDRIRIEGAKNLTRVAAEVDANQYVQPSVVWVARQPDGSKFDESADPNPDRTTKSALEAESIVETAGEEHGFDTAILRYGWFYGPESAQIRNIAENLVSGDMPIVGGGLLGRKDATVSCIHVEDAASALVTAVESDASGLWHVVDEEPVAVESFLKQFASELNADDPSRIPGWLARFFIGKDNVRFFTNSMPTTNRAFKREFDWEPTYPTYRDGVEAVVEAWETENVSFV